MDENVLLSAKQRYVLSDTAGVNEEELADFSRDIVHVVGRLNDDSSVRCRRRACRATA